MTLGDRRGLSKPRLCTQPNTMCTLYLERTMLSPPPAGYTGCCHVFSPWSEWPSIHFLRLRETNLMLSLWASSQGPLLMTPSPVVLTWQQSHSGSIVVRHHTIHWLSSMAQCCMVDKHSHRNISSSFKQIDTSWTSLQCDLPLMDLQNDPIVFRFLHQPSLKTSCWQFPHYILVWIFLPHFSCYI